MVVSGAVALDRADMALGRDRVSADRVIVRLPALGNARVSPRHGACCNKPSIMARASTREPISGQGGGSAAVSRHVLIVEDDAFVRHALQRLLKWDGCRCLTAATVEAARDLLGSCEPALVITDLNLGGSLDGIDLLRWMRLSPHLRSVPMLLMTGDNRGDTRHRLDRVGLADVDILSKPFEQEAIAALAARLGG